MVHVWVFPREPAERQSSGLACPCLFGDSPWLHSVPQIWVMALSVCFVFTVTIGVFPSITAEVDSYIAGETEWSK